MFDFFKKISSRRTPVKPILLLADVNGVPLREGDLVESLRYDLGRCRVQLADPGYAYESLATGERVGWLRMVDAATGFQKVKKIETDA
ncbi:MAG: hypothetical protein H7Z75_22950 [Ferruginibacter sp.]|nr:hypothetical protein [Cytophagales bacterium]